MFVMAIFTLKNEEKEQFSVKGRYTFALVYINALKNFLSQI